MDSSLLGWGGSRKPGRVGRVILLTIILLGVLSVLVSTFPGIGVSPDSVIYIGSARSLLAGNGLRLAHLLSMEGNPVQMDHYPPLYVLALSGLGLVWGDPLSGARWLNVFLMGATLAVSWVLMVFSTGRRDIFSFSGVLVMGVSVPLLLIHSYAWSEPLFVLLCLLGILFLHLYFKDHSWRYLLASSITVGLAFLTRYVGISLILSGFVLILVLGGHGLRKRLAHGFAFGSLAVLPMVVWFLRNIVLFGQVQDRSILFHPVSLNDIWVGVSTVSWWILPGVGWGVARFGAMGFAVVFGLYLLYRMGWFKRESKPVKESGENPWVAGAFSRVFWSSVPGLLLVFAASYLVVLVLAMSFMDALTAMDNRILSPLFIPGIVLAVSLLSHSYRDLASRWTRILGVALAVFIAFYAVLGLMWVGDSFQNGKGYVSSEWQNSEIVEDVESLPRDVFIFSNSPNALYMLTGRVAADIPFLIDPDTDQLRDDYTALIDAMRSTLSGPMSGQDIEGVEGVVVFLYNANRRWFPSSEDILVEEIPLELVVKRVDGAIYKPGV